MLIVILAKIFSAVLRESIAIKVHNKHGSVSVININIENFYTLFDEVTKDCVVDVLLLEAEPEISACCFDPKELQVF